MLLGYVEYHRTTETPDSAGASFLELAFRKADKNRDGEVTRAEYPRPLIFKRLDLNGDDILTLEEVLKAGK